MKKLLLIVMVLCAGICSAQHTINLTPVQDAYIEAYGGGNGKNTFFKFDITSIPANAVLTATNLEAWVYRQAIGWDGDVRYIFFTKQDWTEADSTQELWVDAYYTDTLEQLLPSFGMSVGFSQSIDLTQFLQYNFQAGDPYFSFRMKDPDDPTMFPMINIPIFENSDSLLLGNIFNDHMAMRPRNYANPNQRPKLIVQYGIPPEVGMFGGASPSCEGMSINIMGSATGDAPLFYQWLKNGAPMAGEINATLFIPTADSSDMGNYQLVANNGYGTDTSNVLVITVIPTPEVFLGNDTTMCEINTLTLDAGAGFDTYAWSDGSINQTLLVDNAVAGTYQYWVTVSVSGCLGNDSVLVTEVVCSGLPEIQSSQFAVFPNPSNGAFQLRTELINYIFELYDLQGRLVFASNSEDATNYYDLRFLRDGTYIGIVVSESARERFYLIKE